MIVRFATYLLIPAIIFLLAPFLAGSGHLGHPAPWLGFVLGVGTLASQPPLTPKALVTDADDRSSALMIFVAVVVANLASILQFSWRSEVVPLPDSPWVVAGIVIAVGGMALRLWAIRTLGRFFTSSVMVQEGQRVLSTGPYRAVRHPSYTGTLLTVVGTAIAAGSPIGVGLAALLVLPSYLYRIRVEERTMIGGLGEEYASYRARTPALVPMPW